jgi:hypothetical protein
MNFEKIQNIIQNRIMSKSQKETEILKIIANDPNAIVYVLSLLSIERKFQKDLLFDTNAELSRALVVLSDPHLKAGKKIIVSPIWVVNKIKEHYEKWKDDISCNFLIN